jgi:hypothetical protein
MALGANPKASLPRVFDSAGLEAAYRFFSNHWVMPNEILKEHLAGLSLNSDCAVPPRACQSVEQ